jgi:hypothetical protein
METPSLDTPVPGAVPGWQLTAPESYVLLNGPRASGREAFKRGLLELVARGVLTIKTRTEQSVLGFTTETSELLPGPKSSSVNLTARPLLHIWTLYATSPRYSPFGVRINDLGRSARDQGTPVKGYTRASVVPALMARGFYRCEQYKMLGMFPATRYVETARGAAARTELEVLMMTAEGEFGESARDPREALKLVGMLGPAIVLMDPLFPDLKRLSRALRENAGSERTAGGLELSLSHLDLDSFDFDMGALDSLDGALDAIGDIGDGGGGDGDGGDSGGGD